jgi:hypothetical protein
MDLGQNQVRFTLDRPQVPGAYVGAFMAPATVGLVGFLLLFVGDDFQLMTKRHVFHKKKGEGLLIKNKL